MLHRPIIGTLAFSGQARAREAMIDSSSHWSYQGLTITVLFCVILLGVQWELASGVYKATCTLTALVP